MESIERITKEQIKEIHQGKTREFLKGYLSSENPEDIENIALIEGEKLPLQFEEQTKFLNDPRVSDTIIALIPEKLWRKSQPSESNAENDLILFRENYWDKNDDIAWMTHELAHCLRYKDNPVKYKKDSETFAYSDIQSKYAYPNNKVEDFTFEKQFQFLKQKGLNRQQIREMLMKNYDENEMQFLNTVIDKVFS